MSHLIMRVENPLDILKARQRAWAIANRRATDEAGYCGCADDNLFLGLSAGARNDFDSGDGTELGKRGERGKIQALHSSSALACNWFDYWRGRDTTPLARALGGPGCLFRSRPRTELFNRRRWDRAKYRHRFEECRWNGTRD